MWPAPLQHNESLRIKYLCVLLISVGHLRSKIDILGVTFMKHSWIYLYIVTHSDHCCYPDWQFSLPGIIMDYIEHVDLNVNMQVENSSHETGVALAEKIHFEFLTVVGFWLTGLVCIAGILGNGVCLVVIRHRRECAMFILLRGLLIYDALFLFFTFLLQVITNMFPITGRLQLAYQYSGYCIKFGSPLVASIQSAIVWITVLISLERYAVVCRPLLAVRLCKTTKARMALVTLTVLSIVMNIPKIWERTLRHDDSVTYTVDGALAQNPIYRYVYALALYFTLFFVMPITLLAILTSKLIITLRKARKRWERQPTAYRPRENRGKKLIYRKKHEHTITYVSLAIVFMFVVCGMPDLIIKTLIYVWGVRTGQWMTSLVAVSNLLVVLNSASNLVIYCLMGSQFRMDLKRLLCSRKEDNAAMEKYMTRIREADTYSSNRRQSMEPVGYNAVSQCGTSFLWMKDQGPALK